MSEQPQKDYITTFDQLERCKGHPISLDTETTGLNPWMDDLIGVSFYCESLGLGGYIPTLDSESRVTAKRICSEFPDKNVIVFHNAKFDLHFLRMDPNLHDWTIMDTTVMLHLLDSRQPKALVLAEKRWLGTESKRDKVEAAPARTKIWNWPIRIISAYAANDAKVTWQLAQKLWPYLKEMGLTDLFWKDMEYVKTLYSIEDYGVLIDEEFIEESAEKLQGHLRNMERELMDSCGAQFNWRSPQQLSRAIYDGLGIPKPKNPFADADGVDRSRFADAGKYKSTCTATFILTEKIHHPLGELISSMREADKLRKAFLKWLELKDENNILHTNFNQTGTRTGRLSSSRPNLQNIASQTRGRFTQSVYTGSVDRSDEFNMRRAVIPRPGNCFISVDYKQMEMRMFGILSKDPFMLNALIAGKDVHLEIALKVWGDCGEHMNKVHREWSKTITFGLIYGMTLGSLQYKLNMTRIEAAKVTDQYWGQFPRIKPWMDEIVESCKLDGFLRYWSGRIWKEENPIDMYKGCNALIQGGCADLLSIAAMRVHEWMRKQPNHRLINLVHDETISEVPVDDILRSAKFVSETMQVPDLFGIPFATDVKIGHSYGDMVKVSKDVLNDPSRTSLSMEEVFQETPVAVAEIPDAIDFDDSDEDEDSEES